MTGAEPGEPGRRGEADATGAATAAVDLHRESDEATELTSAVGPTGGGDDPTRAGQAATDSAVAPPALASESTAAPRPAHPLPALGDAPGPILPTDTLAVAGRKAMWIHVDRLLAREPGLRDPERPDDLRKYRVATRRLRAAIRLFAAAYPRHELAPVKDGLTEIARAVGAVRDLDVRIADLNAWVTERGTDDPAVVEPLLAGWRAEREAAARVLSRRLDGRRHRRWLISLVTFVEGSTVAPPSSTHAPRTIRDRTASRVWDAYERVRAYAPVVRWADVETLHETRIETKRLRYSLEFLGDVLGSDRVWLVERLVALQDHLGALNDAVVTSAAVRAFLDEHHDRLLPDERTAIATYLAERERAIVRLRRGLAVPWRGVMSATFVRRLARASIVA